MRIRSAVIAISMSSVLWSAPAMAQQRHVVDASQMRQAIADQTANDQKNRDALLGAIRRPDVRDLADQLGLNLTRAESAVATLNSAELARLATSLPAADVDLAGGSHVVVISTTTLLLVLIIVILLVR
jgi:hypothetical protein